MADELTPVIREEEYFAAMAGQDVTPPDPATRKEEWLGAIVSNLDTISADLSTAEGEIDDLQDIAPTPAAADSGKVLTAGADGTGSWQNSVAPVPAVADSGKVLTAGADGTASWQNSVAPVPAVADSGKVLTAGADGTASWQAAGGIYSLSADVQTAVQTLISAVITDILTSSRTVPIRKSAHLNHSGASSDFGILDAAVEAFEKGFQVATPVAAGTYARALQAYKSSGVAQLEFYIPVFGQDIPGVGATSFTLGMTFTGTPSSMDTAVVMQLITDIS